MTAPAARRPWTRAQLAVAAAGLLSVVAGVAVYVALVAAAGTPAATGDRAWTAAQQLLSGVVWILTGRLQVQGARLRRETLRELER